ncbi:UvrD-helicase domain-containing protein [Bacteroidales bacterium AH-315-I05]|nr:UvrD-helicase domain-containing protein [Bacteroidales bacterium AH-315-I05]
MSFTVYKSSAGSGKTYTLVKQYLKIALQNEQPDAYKGILAITFTNKAASEMKERVLDALKAFSAEDIKNTNAFLFNDLLKELSFDEATLKNRAKKTLEHILHHYTDFSVSTIDKFTHRIVRTFAYDLKIPLNFEVEMDTDALLSVAVDTLISRVGSNEKLTKALVEFTESKADDEKSWHIENELLSFSKYLLEEDGKIHIEKLKNISLDDFFKIRNQLVGQIKEFESEVKKIGKKALQTIENAGVERSTFYYGDLPNYFKKLNALNVNGLLPGPRLESAMEEGNWFSGKATDFDKENINAIKPELEDLYLKAINYVESHEKDFHLFSLIYKNIYSLAVLNEIEQIIDEIRNDKNLIHISEFNQRIAEIVMNEPIPFIYERIGSRYTHYLIDEFQDTSVLQWHNLLPLIDNSLATGNFNMVVGDGKQAIYRWRGGEVEQIAHLPKVKNRHNNPLIAEREATLQRWHKEKTLANNFRSKAEIVQFNNFFFKKLSERLNGDYQKIYEAVEQNFDEKNTGGMVSIEVLGKNEELTIEEETLTRVKQLIENCLRDGFELSEIAILCRKNMEASAVAVYLLEQGIDVVSAESLLLSNSSEVNFIISILQWIVNSNDQIAKTAILQFLVKSDKIQGEIHGVLSEATRNGMDEVLRKNSLYIRRNKLIQLPVYECIEEIIRVYDLNDETNIYIAFFLDFAHRYSIKNSNNFSEFLHHWEEQKNKQSIVLPDGLNAVRLLTIHKSKGLEFPVVIFPFANWAVKVKKDDLWVTLEHPKINGLKSALLPTNKTLEKTDYSAQYVDEESKSLLDDFNLLYVAFTRPRERLHVLTSEDSRKKLSKEFLGFLKKNEHWNEQKSSYCFGNDSSASSRTTAKKPGQESEKMLQIKKLISDDWRGKIVISLQAPEYWDFDNFEKEKNYGKLLHLALSKITTENDVTKALGELFLEGTITADEQNELKKTITALFSKETIKPFFAEGLKVKTEAEILLENGDILRPDRLILSENSAVVIDYKTGAKQPAHIEQIKKYGNALLEMNYQNVEMYLIYTEVMEVEKI